MAETEFMGEWGAQSFQAVWFTSRGPGDASQIFEAMLGAKPDSAQQVSLGSAVASGIAGNLHFRVQSQVGRLDYFEVAVSPSLKEFALIHDLSEAFDRFSNRVLRGRHAVGEAGRLAVVVNLAKQLDHDNDISAEIQSLLNVQMPFSDGSDFAFQVNRRRPISSRQGLTMNRLLKLQSQIAQQLDLLRPDRPLAQTLEIATFTVDCNTFSLEEVALQPDDQLPIWNELIEESRELATARTLEALS